MSRAAFTDAVRRAVEGLAGPEAAETPEVYRGAVATAMRVVFRRFAEARGLLPESDDRALPPPLRAIPRLEAGALDVERLGQVYESLLSSALRRNTGAHYTPRYLAEEVVAGALEPLVYAPGPLQTADRARWRRRSSADILALNVADIAMGSGAFLVAAARYLADHLVQAWSAEGVPADGAEARRQVIEQCLYGVDIDPTAAELAKLSLWLLAMGPGRPYPFLGNHLIVGDSLLGITSLDQLGPVEPDGRMGRFADLVAGAVLATGGRDGGYAGAAGLVREVVRRGGEPEAARTATDRTPGALDRRPVHWPLAFPEVFARGGFDAVVGNPPFLGGQKLTGALGTAYREMLVNTVGRGARGSADLVAYFALRAHDLLGAAGQTGLIATNTLAQGDTREVGLERIVAEGAVIRQAVRSRRWPSRSPVLDYCAVWTTRQAPAATARCLADGVPVERITPSLEAASRARGVAHRLAANAGLSFQGSNILGLGFTVAPDGAAELIRKDARNTEVLFPYLNGHDLNLRPDCTASRWVVNFHDWTEERARAYTDCYGRVRRLVRPERLKVTFSRGARERWWLYERRRPELYAQIAGLARVVAIALVSRTVMPVMVPTGQVFSHMLGVFATDDTALLALLSSAPHYWWAAGRASTMKTDLRYTPSDVFETLPLPEPTPRMRALGDRLDRRRRDIMGARGTGLTATYSLVNDAACTDGDIVELRRIHRDIDVAVCAAYGWDELLRQGLGHGFHRTGRHVRYTAGPDARREMVDLLLELNHRRYAREAADGLHGKRKARRLAPTNLERLWLRTP
ncbi:Eco57I restriction-modification methylase domain-containing protein [Dactylosporangium sp. CA-092794]|uniref:Eco57I restriction-modification methylase domain-containing protein n=1 Tax=Dactylosporangium sp. CA-092794 TaxID=3239929 RepID=UPI003D909C45